ncbi:MAG: branched-chain amino acid ABC transporter permease [Actinomycetota bacterium]|nr:branched-chain amino acid ABC transporter permease [Actinomycetota bacterium]
MRLFVQALILGVLAGGVYALMASGLSLAFGIMRVINVAQGVMIILGAYLSYSLFTTFHLDPFLSILLVMPLVFALGVMIQLAFLRPLHGRDREQLSLLVTWAVALGIEGVLGVVYATTYRSTIPSYANGSWRVAGFSILQVQVYAFLLSVVVLSLLGLLLTKTRFGRAVRGTVQNPTSAALLGVDERKVAAIGFGISVATAAAAGAVYGIVNPFNPGSHYDLISLLLTIIVLGGLGSLPGTIVAAMVVGVAEALLATYISPTWGKFAFFILLISVLVVRPQGLFGTVERGSL